MLQVGQFHVQTRLNIACDDFVLNWKAQCHSYAVVEHGLHLKRSVVSTKTRSPSACFLLKVRTQSTTVNWSIQVLGKIIVIIIIWTL